MKKYNCEICNYSTDHKASYTRHCGTKRHQQNIATIPKNVATIPREEEFSCNFCNKIYKRKCHLNRHLKKCDLNEIEKLKKINKEYKLSIDIQKEEINTLKQEKEQLIKNQKEEINTLTNELNDAFRLIQEYQLKVKDTEIRCLKEVNKININNNSHNRTNITQYIINKYPNAKNVTVPDEVSGLEHYASDKVEHNVNKLLTSIYKNNINPEERSIWCIDSARNKYLTRLDNLWKVDLYGMLFCEKVCKQLARRCNDYIYGNGGNKLNEYDMIRSISMITDLLGRKKLTGPIKGEFIVNTLEEKVNEENVENQ